MRIVIDVTHELVVMFVADARLVAATLILVAVAAVPVLFLQTLPLVRGMVLAIGCPAILVEASLREAKRRKP